MTSVVEYFVRHYGLVINNDQGSYLAVRGEIGAVTKNSDVTLAEFRAMDRAAKDAAFASEIGTVVLSVIEGWVTEAIGEQESVGSLLIREIMIFNGGELEYALGQDFMPEDSEADEFFSDDSEL